MPLFTCCIRYGGIGIRFSSNSITIHVVQVRVHSLIGMSGFLSTGKCIDSDAPLLDLFFVSHHNRQIREVVSVCWKAPSVPLLKVNTDGFVIGNHGACGGLFRDHLGTFLRAFTSNLGSCSIFTAEVHGFILDMEYAAHNGWTNIWLESDSTNAILVFKNIICRWCRFCFAIVGYNGCSLGIQVISSYIFGEGNCCADRLASMGHSVDGDVWLLVLPPDLQAEFYSDSCVLPRYRFP